jgi:hypothetical protein
MAERDCYYVAAHSGEDHRGVPRFCLLAGPYSSKEQADFMVKPVMTWATEHSGDPWAWAYSYGVLMLSVDHNPSKLGRIGPDSELLGRSLEELKGHQQRLAEASRRPSPARDKDRGRDR